MKPKLTEQDYIYAARQLNCEVAAIKAVADVESAGDGFLKDDNPKILFERHKFYKHTNGKFAKTHPDICNKIPGGYGKESDQHPKLQRAMALNRDAALMSCSWGKFQIMGEHWQKLRYKSLQDFINKMYESEAAQLDAFVSYIIVFGLLPYIRAKNWPKFAELYNGKNYKINKYDEKMASAYKKYSK